MFSKLEVANSASSDQTVHAGVWSGSILLTQAELSKNLGFCGNHGKDSLLSTGLSRIIEFFHSDKKLWHILKHSFHEHFQRLARKVIKYSYGTGQFCQIIPWPSDTTKHHSRERSGSVVECLTRDRRAAGSSLTGITALWSLSKTHLS